MSARTPACQWQCLNPSRHDPSAFWPPWNRIFSPHRVTVTWPRALILLCIPKNRGRRALVARRLPPPRCRCPCHPLPAAASVLPSIAEAFPRLSKASCGPAVSVAGARQCRLPPFGPSPHVALLARTYSRSRPQQPDKRLSQNWFFPKREPSVSQVATDTGRTMRPWARARLCVCVVAPVRPR